MSGHTPGPWQIGRYGEVLTADGKILLVSGVAMPLANHPRAAEAAANARLIASATALVEALTSARDYITSELARERDTLMGHENCSDIPSIKQDLARTDAALRAAGVEL